MIPFHVLKSTRPVDSGQIDRLASIPETVMDGCAGIGLFGQRIDSEFGGLGMTALESTRVAESMGLDASVFATVTAHEALGIKVDMLNRYTDFY